MFSRFAGRPSGLGYRRRNPLCTKATLAVPPSPPVLPQHVNNGQGHVALLHGLGQVGDVPPTHMPWLLRLAHVRSRITGGDSNVALQESARGALLWKAALERGLLPDDAAIAQLFSKEKKDSFSGGHPVEELRWPEEPLRQVLIRRFSRLGVARFAQKYPAVRQALILQVLELVCKFHKTVLGEADDLEERGVDEKGNKYKTVAELQAEEQARSAVRGTDKVQRVNPNMAAMMALQQKKAEEQERQGKGAGAQQPMAPQENEEDGDEDRELWSKERVIAEDLVKALVALWRVPIATLSKAGRAFEGLEALLGGSEFDVGGGMWERKGWAEMDSLRSKLEDLKELRDLVRSLGRGGGWGPLRRAPVQRLEMKGRPGLLRTVLEAQETRGLTRSDDISRLLPSEAAVLARGRTVRQAKLLFYAKLAEKGLQTYERDGWGEFPTQINPDRREIRPTADRGPILLCVDTSGSMRGARETVAKALTLECMRAAKVQERGCYVFAFAGLQEVRELELNMDLKSVNNLLEFLEKPFNGGSDFNAPIVACLDRLHDSKWANSDILLVSDGELRQPGGEIMRKLSGAKQGLSLRVHGLILGSPEKQRADPAVLRGLCSHTLPNGKNETIIHEFDSWSSVNKNELGLVFDWDDIEGNAKRREAGLKMEKLRLQEVKRRRGAMSVGGGRGGKKKPDKMNRMPTAKTTSFE